MRLCEIRLSAPLDTGFGDSRNLSLQVGEGSGGAVDQRAASSGGRTWSCAGLHRRAVRCRQIAQGASAIAYDYAGEPKRTSIVADQMHRIKRSKPLLWRMASS